ncbi:MAG TPA: DUF488 family protein [Acidimicrobiia bacterium]|nr:DUF488 family protein [Acidimicrobiia bacterium]
MAKRSRVRVARVYDEPGGRDGTRVLVDRLWPRGLKKDDAVLDHWCREIAPSTELRKWYGHDPDRFAEFAERYRAELDDADHAEALAALRRLAGRPGGLTLLTATKSLELSQAAVLASVLG